MIIYFNHWFSTAYHFINLLKKEGYYVISSNQRDTCVYQKNSDEFYVEKPFNKKTYVDECLDFCKKHNVDIFFPKKGMNLIIERKDEFEKIGVQLVCETDIDKYNIFQDKFKTFDFFKKHKICNVCEMEKVNTLNEFKIAYEKLSKKYDRICIKYNIDEGAQSFKEIVKESNDISILSIPNELSISYEQLCNCLGSVNSFPDLLVMPYLDGIEISIDCIGINNELIAIPRYKLSNRITKIDLNEEFIKIANNFYKYSKLKGPFNIQLRYHKDKLYLLEVNTRLSGGSWKASYVGIDFPNLCIHQLKNDLTILPKPTYKELNLSNIEEIVVL